MKKRIALIDGGEVCFRIGAGSEIRRYYIADKNDDPEEWVASFQYKKDVNSWFDRYDPEHTFFETIFKSKPVSRHTAVDNADTFIQDIIDSTNAEDVLVCFGNPRRVNIRDIIATFQPYKERPTGRPYHYDNIKVHIKNTWPWTETWKQFEDDDVLAIKQLEYESNTEWESIICTHDKDLLQVPGLHYNTDSKEIRMVSDQQANAFFYSQMLAGDPIDTIPGLYKITGKRNLKKYTEELCMLTDPARMYEHVYNIYSWGLGNRDNFGDSDLDCILWEIGNLLYLRRNWNEREWKVPSEQKS